MEGWGKIGVQSASVLYPNSCYIESCYIEVQVYYYIVKQNYSVLSILGVPILIRILMVPENPI